MKSLEGLPEALHPHFAKVSGEEGDEFEYRPPSGKTDQDVARTQTALRKEREQRTAQEQRAADLARQVEELKNRLTIDGEEVDPEEIRHALEERRQRNGKEVITTAEADRRAELRAKKAADAAIAKEQAGRADLEAKLRAKEEHLARILVDGGIQGAVNSPDLPFRLKPQAVDDLVRYIRDNNLARVEDGRLIVYGLDGEPKTKADGSPGELVDLIPDIIPRKPHWVMESQGAGASPSVGGSGGGLGIGRKSWLDASKDERSDYIDKYGAEKYAEWARQSRRASV